MSEAAPAALVSARVGEAQCVVFAYHEIGYACMEELISLGAPIAALFTHEDNPGEEIWWRCMRGTGATGMTFRFSRLKSSIAAWIERIAALKPAVIYSFYYRNLIADEVLRLAKRGAYNLHGSMLPKYRGRAPVNWMLVNGETRGRCDAPSYGGACRRGRYRGAARRADYRR